MIGKLISAGIGSKVAEHTPGVSQGAGAMLGMIAATAARRMGPFGLAASAAGIWLYSRHVEAKKQQAATTKRKASRARKPSKRNRTVTSPAPVTT